MLYSRRSLVIEPAPTLEIRIENDVSFFNWLRAITGILLASSTTAEGPTGTLKRSHHFLHTLHMIREGGSDPACIYSIYFMVVIFTLFHDDYS